MQLSVILPKYGRRFGVADIVKEIESSISLLHTLTVSLLI